MVLSRMVGSCGLREMMMTSKSSTAHVTVIVMPHSRAETSTGFLLGHGVGEGAEVSPAAAATHGPGPVEDRSC